MKVLARRSERVAFRGGNGFELAGIIDIPDDEPRGTAIFTHCFTCNKDLKAIVRVSRGLAETGMLVLRYDLTGLGNSQGDFSKTDFSSNRADLLAAVEFMRSNFAAPDFLIGHSFGGACSLSVAEDLPSVRGVATLASPSDTGHLADILLRMDPKIATAGQGSVTIGGRQYTIRREMLDDFRSFDLPAILRKLTKPTLLFHSPEDETLGFEHVLRLFGLLTQRGPHDPEASSSSLVCLPGADHLLVKNPADFEFVTASLAAWFQRLLVERSG